MDKNNHKFKSADIYRTKAGTGAQYFSERRSQKIRKPHKFELKVNPKLLCRILTVSLIILVLAVAVFAIYTFIHHSTEQTTEAPSEVAFVVDNEGDTSEIIDQYQSRIDSATNDADKAVLYLSRSAEFVSRYIKQGQTSSSDIKQALDDALRAEELNPTPASASQIADIYKYLNDDAKSEKYTQKAQERIATIQANLEKEKNSE